MTTRDEIRERLAKALHSDGKGTMDAALGWCSTHDSMAQRFGDGSIGCHYLTVVERSSGGCTFTSHLDAVLGVLDHPTLLALLGMELHSTLTVTCSQAHPGQDMYHPDGHGSIDLYRFTAPENEQ